MVRKAVFADIGSIEETYNEHFAYEIENGAFTVFIKGIYPTVDNAKKAIECGSLYVYEDNNRIAGSMIADRLQPAEYSRICWEKVLGEDEVMVIHLLLVRPGMTGKGVASSLVDHAVRLAEGNLCKALRLDTGRQNIPAVSFYKKMGFRIVAQDSMKVGNVIEHSGHLFLEKIL